MIVVTQEEKHMSDQALNYKGYRVRISLRESGNESATGVFLSTISFAPDQGSDNPDVWVHWERASASIHLDAGSACKAAVTRVKSHIDTLTGASI